MRRSDMPLKKYTFTYYDTPRDFPSNPSRVTLYDKTFVEVMVQLLCCPPYPVHTLAPYYIDGHDNRHSIAPTVYDYMVAQLGCTHFDVAKELAL